MTYTNNLTGTDGNNILSGDNNNNVLTGKGGDDILSGNGGSDFLSGGSGNDVLGGSIGEDWLYGGEGNDTLLGGGNDDQIWGSDSFAKGAYEVDYLKGDGGADLFVLGTTNAGGGAWYTANGGRDYAIIQDFNYMDGDKVQLYGNFNDYDTFTGNWFGSSNTDTALTYKDEVIAVFQDVSGSDFIIGIDANFVS